jgi:hypothetical protein
LAQAVVAAVGDVAFPVVFVEEGAAERQGLLLRSG